LRVAYVIESFSTFITDEIRELRRQGVEVTLFSAFRPLLQADPVADGLRRQSLYFPPWYGEVMSANLRHLLRRPRRYLEVARVLLREGEGLRMLLLAGYLAGQARRIGVQHLHATYATRTSTLAHAIARLAGLDWSFSAHAYDLFRHNSSIPWKARSASFVRTISEFNRRFLVEHYPGVDPRRVRVCYLGVDVTRFRPVAADVDSRTPVVLSVGHLNAKKGHRYLLGACRRLLDRGVGMECRIVGEGQSRPLLEERLRSLNLEPAVRLLGGLTHEDTSARLREASLFVLACVDRRPEGEDVDGIPVALMEAMAMGLPVVSTRVSGIPELVEDGVSGLLVPERDEEALADALERLLKSTELRTSLGRAARRRIQERFEIVANTRALRAAFEATVGA
jgi:colanic acid/amylovoran biosynthesis glycosyltransferase